MALTVPPQTPLSEFGWIFHDNHLDSSIYQDEDIMEFSDSSADYQTPPHQSTQPQQQTQQQVSRSICKSSAIFTRKTQDKRIIIMWCFVPIFHLTLSVSKLKAFQRVLIRVGASDQAIYCRISNSERSSLPTWIHEQFRYIKV